MENLTDEEFDKAVATALGWTELHGGPSEGGMYLRGWPPGIKHGLMEAVPSYYQNISRLRGAVLQLLERQHAGPCQLLLDLISLGSTESGDGSFKVSLDYDNYQDGAHVRNGDGNTIASCYLQPDDESLDGEQIAEWQFVEAIKAAVATLTDKDDEQGS